MTPIEANQLTSTAVRLLIEAVVQHKRSTVAKACVYRGIGYAMAKTIAPMDRMNAIASR